MKERIRRLFNSLTSVCLVLTLAGSSVCLESCARTSGNQCLPEAKSSLLQLAPDNNLKPETSEEKPVSTAPALSDIKVYFKLDPSLTRGVYMGDRWVSPATYASIQAGHEAIVELRAQGVDLKGYPRIINPEWSSSDVDMVAVAPNRGNAVTLTARKTGQSTLTVESQGYSKELFIETTQKNDSIKIEISQ